VSSPQSGHVALIKGAFRLYEAGDFDALWALADPDVEFKPVFVPGSYQGLEAVSSFIMARGDPRTRWRAADLEFHEVGARVVVAGRLHTRAVLGTPLNLPIAFVFHLRDRLITRMEGHMTLAQAVRSAGLSTPA
jgi:ketosteroid isomerase-like protein